jgi:thiol-disulfide isomerase/thioredoxin
MTKRITLALALLALVLAATGASGCGSSDGNGSGSEPPDYERLLAGSPAPLAALHEQANELLPGGPEAYEERLADLRGYPVVTNVWASWCMPCRVEFPVLQKLAARYGKEVAFLGVDYEDDADAAKTFLEATPVPYPSYSDPGAEIGDEAIGGKGLPRTAYYDREGNLCYLRIGQYADDEALEEDVRRFAVREECDSG